MVSTSLTQELFAKQTIKFYRILIKILIIVLLLFVSFLKDLHKFVLFLYIYDVTNQDVYSTFKLIFIILKYPVIMFTVEGCKFAR
jgi:thioredoxin-related protein